MFTKFDSPTDIGPPVVISAVNVTFNKVEDGDLVEVYTV